MWFDVMVHASGSSLVLKQHHCRQQGASASGNRRAIDPASHHVAWWGERLVLVASFLYELFLTLMSCGIEVGLYLCLNRTCCYLPIRPLRFAMSKHFGFFRWKQMWMFLILVILIIATSLCILFIVHIWVLNRVWNSIPIWTTYTVAVLFCYF